MSARRKLPALAVALLLALPPFASAQFVTLRKMGPEFQVNVRAEISGDVSVNAWSRNGGRELAPVLPEVVRCRGNAKVDGTALNRIVCQKALQRDGLALEEVIDLAPIARNLDASTPIQLWLNFPRLGFESSSIDLTEEKGGAEMMSRSHRFDADSVPPAIHVRFGYRPDQLAGIYLPLVGLALAFTMIAFPMSRAGLAALSRSAVLLGMMVWMGVAAQLGADRPLRILLFGSPYANVAALLLAFWPPLFCIAIGVALGSRLRAGQTRSGRATETLGSLAVIPLMLTCVVGSLPSLTSGDWVVGAMWLAATPAILVLRRAWLRARMRAGTRSSVRQLTSGELKERISLLAARARCPSVKIYLSFPKRAEMSNAFALPGKSIFLTAPLVRSLSKREVDAVAAHELSHFRHSGRGIWTALCLAMLLCETPAKELVSFLPGGLLTAMLVPIAVFLASLHGMRKREFAADAGAATLTGDPRAMISSLARIARNNNLPPDMNPVAEWFSSHPSNPRRIRALAAAARLDAAEVERLCGSDDPGESYAIPQEEADQAIFTPLWQMINARIYGWVVILGSCGAGLLAAWLADRFDGNGSGGYGAVGILAGIALGCIATKGLAATATASNFARLHRRLEARIGVKGQLVGLAMDSEPRLYNGFRFSDAGILRFEGGRLCYKSERVTIALNPVDVVEVSMVSASPSNWVRQQPMVRFRGPESCGVQAFILHPVEWLPTQRRLLKSIELWRAAQSPAESTPERTSLNGFHPIAGQAFTSPTVIDAARGFLLPGGLTFLAAALTRPALQTEWWYVGFALMVAACSHLFLYLPAMLYRSSATPPTLAAPVDAK